MSGTGPGRPGKVRRLLEEYKLGELGDKLVQMWTCEGNNRQSLRELADYFNIRILESAMVDADMQTIESEIENTYRLLTDKDASGSDRTRIQRRLEREGIDVESLREDFVSYQAIRTYLTTHRGAEQPDSGMDTLESDRQTIQQLRSRLQTVSESKLERLRETGAVTLGEFRVLVDARVVCEDCGTQRDIDALFMQGACDCS